AVAAAAAPATAAARVVGVAGRAPLGFSLSRRAGNGCSRNADHGSGFEEKQPTAKSLFRLGRGNVFEVVFAHCLLHEAPWRAGGHPPEPHIGYATMELYHVQTDLPECGAILMFVCKQMNAGSSPRSTEISS